MGKFTGLRCACLVGGDNIEEHFEALHQNPDMYVWILVQLYNSSFLRILATPGRLLHVAVEMNLKLNQVCYVVFDEAGRELLGISMFKFVFRSTV